MATEASARAVISEARSVEIAGSSGIFSFPFDPRVTLFLSVALSTHSHRRLLDSPTCATPSRPAPHPLHPLSLLSSPAPTSPAADQTAPPVYQPPQDIKRRLLFLADLLRVLPSSGERWDRAGVGTTDRLSSSTAGATRIEIRQLLPLLLLYLSLTLCSLKQLHWSVLAIFPRRKPFLTSFCSTNPPAPLRLLSLAPFSTLASQSPTQSRPRRRLSSISFPPPPRLLPHRRPSARRLAQSSPPSRRVP